MKQARQTETGFASYYQRGVVEIKKVRSGAKQKSSRWDGGEAALDLGQLEVVPIRNDHNLKFDENNDCILYAMVACLEYFGYRSQNNNSCNVVSAIKHYIALCSDKFMGSSFTVARAVHILETYMGFVSVGGVTVGQEYDFESPALCRVGYFGSMGTHCAFIACKKIYCVEEERLDGHRVYECRRIDFKQN